VQEFLELLGRNELEEDVGPLVGGEGGAVEDRLHLLLEPFALALVRDVGQEFRAERAAVGEAQFLDQVAQRPVERAVKTAADNLLVQVIGREAELRQVEQRMGGSVVAERIELGDEVPQLAVAVYEI